MPHSKLLKQLHAPVEKVDEKKNKYCRAQPERESGRAREIRCEGPQSRWTDTNNAL